MSYREVYNPVTGKTYWVVDEVIGQGPSGGSGGANVTGGDAHDHAGGDGAQIDHGGLAGLSDDDHPQYTTPTEVEALTAIVVYVPASVAETGDGSLASGNAASLASQDGNVVHIDESSGGTGYTVDIGYTGVSGAFDNIVIFGRYDGGASHQCHVQIWNYDTTAYDTIGVMPHSTIDETYAFPIVNFVHYVSAGAVLVRLQHNGTGNNTHDLYLDMVILRKGGASGGGVTEHGSLTGLGDDDHTQYIRHSLATAASDFLVASGSGAFVKKTLAEAQSLLGVPDATAWTAVSFDAGLFTASASMTWTVAAGDMTRYRYKITGKMMSINLYLVTTTVGGTPDYDLRVTLPESKTSASDFITPILIYDNGTYRIGKLIGTAGVGYLTIRNNVTDAIWAASTNNTHVFYQGSLEIN